MTCTRSGQEHEHGSARTGGSTREFDALELLEDQVVEGVTDLGVLANVGIGEVVRDGVVLRVVLCTNKEWVSIWRAWAHGCVGRTLSFSGDTGAPKKYCRSVHAQRGGRVSA